MVPLVLETQAVQEPGHPLEILTAQGPGLALVNLTVQEGHDLALIYLTVQDVVAVHHAGLLASHVAAVHQVQISAPYDLVPSASLLVDQQLSGLDEVPSGQV